ncbi:MAG: SDR family oxidoreductase [SAR202 cluster bacterium]|nr:SDR family oxidoreductase [SAR202 cluster bacterium]
MFSLSGRNAIVVGTKRIGSLVAHRMAQEGINLAIVYRSSRDEAEELRASVAKLTAKACVVQGDLTIEEDAKRLVARTIKELGSISFVVNLASDFPRTPFDALDGEAWDRGMATAKGTYLLAVNAARAMMQNAPPTRGHMLFFGDWAAGETPYRDYLPYLTGKAAVHSLTKTFAAELAERGILVNAIAPGPMMRPDSMSEEEWARHLAARTPLKRESSPDEIAELVIALLKSETITGEIIRVDAGRHILGTGTIG